MKSVVLGLRLVDVLKTRIRRKWKDVVKNNYKLDEETINARPLPNCVVQSFTRASIPPPPPSTNTPSTKPKNKGSQPKSHDVQAVEASAKNEIIVLYQNARKHAAENGLSRCKSNTLFYIVEHVKKKRKLDDSFNVSYYMITKRLKSG